jgi:hypothetical protein
MDDIRFNLINNMLIELQHSHELCHTNGVQTHIINPYNYRVSVIDICTASRRELNEQESISYLEFHGDPRQDKWSFIASMKDYIRSCAHDTDSFMRNMDHHDISFAIEAVKEGRVHHWNGAQLYTSTVSGDRVVAYDFTCSLPGVMIMTLASSWVYQQSTALKHISTEDIETVQWATARATARINRRYYR